MKIKSALVTQISGSIGGMTGAHNQSGMYLRARGLPTNPNSARQQVMRMYMDTAVTYWTETLSTAERESWRNYAANVPLTNKLGDPINVSGQNMFVRSAVPWLLGGQALSAIETAPAVMDTGDPGTLSLTTISATEDITITIDGAPGWAAQDNARIFGFMGLPQNPGRSFYKGPFRFVAAVPGNTTTPITTADFPTSLADPQIQFAAGQRIFFRCRAQYDDGRLTQSFIFTGLAS